jgi:putative FmdB family regulatory protein
MPIYEYSCEWCERRFESYRRSDDRDQPTDCPACSKRTAARRIWSVVAVRVATGRAAPRSGAEALAGPGVRGLGARPSHGRTSIIQSCGGLGHRH